MSQQTHWGLNVEKKDASARNIHRIGKMEWEGEPEGVERVEVKGLKIAKTYPDLVVPFEPQKGETLYLVYVLRSSGDSMSSESGIFEAIAVYRTKSKATLALNAIKNHNEWKLPLSNDKRMALLDELDQLMMVSVSWVGYFDQLDEVHLMSVSVKA